VQKFVDKAGEALADEKPANMVLLRGFARRPEWPSFTENFGIKAAAIAGYPMYRGLAELVGMEVLKAHEDLNANLDILRLRWEEFDFFYIHAKQTDSAGEDGDSDRKLRVIEDTDKQIPGVLALKPNVIIVTGDHSTPARLKSHSWHPVPVLLWSPHCRPDSVERFGERACVTGSLGPRLSAADLMPLALAHAMRLDKFGA